MGIFDIFGGGGSGSEGYYRPPEVVQHPQYSFTEPRLQQTSDFIAGNIANMQAGKYPTYYANALPNLRAGMQRPLQQTYFGSGGMGGQGSVMGQIRETGAALGTGPRNTIGRENKALYDYAEKEKAIDEYLTKLGVDITAQAAYQQPLLSSSMPKGPDVTVFPGQYYGAAQTDGGTMGNAFGNLLGNPQTLSSLGNLLGGLTNNGNGTGANSLFNGTNFSFGSSDIGSVSPTSSPWNTQATTSYGLGGGTGQVQGWDVGSNYYDTNYGGGSMDNFGSSIGSYGGNYSIF